MNPIDDRLAAGDDPRLDQLVDDELGETERRDLLVKLDAEPDGWRRCALAFLEAQAWRRTIASMVRREPAPQGAASKAVQRSAGLRPGWTLLAMAASFLMALGLGSQLPGLWQGPGPVSPSPAEVAEIVPGARQPVAPAERPEAVTPWTQQVAEGPAGPWQLVDFPLQGENGQRAHTVSLPAIRQDRFDEDQLRSLPTAVPADVLQALQRAGYRVDQQREVFPYQLQDGRQLVVPVDNVKVHYVGRPAL